MESIWLLLIVLFLHSQSLQSFQSTKEKPTFKPLLHLRKSVKFVKNKNKHKHLRSSANLNGTFEPRHWPLCLHSSNSVVDLIDHWHLNTTNKWLLSSPFDGLWHFVSYNKRFKQLQIDFDFERFSRILFVVLNIFILIIRPYWFL